MTGIWIQRGILAVLAVGLAYRLGPFGSGAWENLALGAAVAAAAIAIEAHLRTSGLKKLIGAGAGLSAGLGAAVMVCWILSSALEASVAGPIEIAVLLILGYVGLTIGAAHSDSLNLGALELFGGEDVRPLSRKIVDTSAIIDGRISDVVETGFLDGPLIIPQFVLWELQLVADSSDAHKRNRGRRGLDILQHLQKKSAIDVQIVDNDYPDLREVDQKLIELAKEIDGQIITTDFNLNKLAELHGVKTLNVNELANALRPVVLPGEVMQVFILKEGKEYNQGVAYLDDGTMVVVDNARRQISKTIEITVTSVLQTTAGKMIFGRYDESAEAEGGSGRPATKAVSAGRQYSSPKVGHPSGK